MGAETMEWYNTQILVGHAEKRGKAWHYKESAQGVEPNHYPGAIPVADVQRRLFNWKAEEAPVYVQIGGQFVLQEDRKAIVRSDNHHVMGLFKSGYAGHDYTDWLIDNVATILNDGTDLGIGSAGLLRQGAQAFVQVEVPENVHTPEGVSFRPNLLACTSFDGSLATTYKRTVTIVVCDNTMEAGLSEKGQTFKVKHSKHSNLKIADAREALAIVSEIEESFTQTVAALCQWDVDTRAWDLVLDALVPVDEGSKRSVTVGDRKREELQALWTWDSRCAPWNGTAFGVLQTFNTWEHHMKATRKDTVRGERNMVEALTGKIGENDNNVLATLAKVQGRELAVLLG